MWIAIGGSVAMATLALYFTSQGSMKFLGECVFSHTI
jgi:hypothetical protein